MIPRWAGFFSRLRKCPVSLYVEWPLGTLLQSRSKLDTQKIESEVRFIGCQNLKLSALEKGLKDVVNIAYMNRP